MDAVLGVALLLGALVLASYGAVGLGSLPERLFGDAAHWKHVGAARQLAQVRHAVWVTRREAAAQAQALNLSLSLSLTRCGRRCGRRARRCESSSRPSASRAAG